MNIQASDSNGNFQIRSTANIECLKNILLLLMTLKRTP